EKAGFDYGVLPIPRNTGGNAAAPTGGEFVTVPVQGDTGRYATSRKLVSCLTSAQNLLDTDTTLSYVAPTAEVQDKQIAANPKLEPWVHAVRAAKGRTSDDLGTHYPKISEQLWKAVQSALSGAASPKDALAKAQSAAQ
ncbi:extracellular solute-binding protein, partial [Streptomyces stelliscabiei]